MIYLVLLLLYVITAIVLLFVGLIQVIRLKPGDSFRPPTKKILISVAMLLMAGALFWYMLSGMAEMTN